MKNTLIDKGEDNQKEEINVFDDVIKRISPKLKGITKKLNRYHSFIDDDDLFQEALIYLWNNLNTGKLIGKTDSYVLQGCYFHLRNYLRKVRDKFEQVSLYDFIDEDGNLFLDVLSTNRLENFEKEENEILQDDNLTEREKKVLAFLLEGLTLREIGEKIGVSHVMVVKIKKNLRKKLSGYQN